MIIELSSLQKSAIFLAGECYWLSFCSSWLDIGQVHFFCAFHWGYWKNWYQYPVILTKQASGGSRGGGPPYFLVLGLGLGFFETAPPPLILESGWPLPSLSEGLVRHCKLTKKNSFLVGGLACVAYKNTWFTWSHWAKH